MVVCREVVGRGLTAFGPAACWIRVPWDAVGIRTALYIDPMVQGRLGRVWTNLVPRRDPISPRSRCHLWSSVLIRVRLKFVIGVH